MESLKEPNRNREVVTKVQKVAHETQTRSVFQKTEREAFANTFADFAIAHIQILSDSHELPFSIISEHREKSLDLFRSVVKLHVAAFSKANGDNLNGTIFDTKTVDPEIIKNRNEYIGELMSIALENVSTLHSDTKGFKLATYRTAEWITAWMNGSLIKERLEKKHRYTTEQVTEFLERFQKNLRIQTAVKNIKDPEGALETIAHNYLVTLSDEGIRSQLRTLFTEDEIATFVKDYPKNLRMRNSVMNIRNPEIILKKIATNYLRKLTDETIAFHFSEKLSVEDIQTFLHEFPKSTRMQTAIQKAGDIETGLDAIATGIIKIPNREGKRFSFSFKTKPSN